MLIYTDTLKYEKFVTLIFTKIPEKSKCKLPISPSIYFKDFIKCLRVEWYSDPGKKFINNNKHVQVDFYQKAHLHSLIGLSNL